MSKLEVDTIDTKTGTNNLTIKQNDTTAITIDTSQNVGIGTTSPSSPLHVKTTGSSGTETEVLRLETTGTNDSSGITLDMRTSHINTQIAMVDGSGSYDGMIVFRTASGSALATPSERMRIDGSGNIMVGTTDTDPAFNNVVGTSILSGGQVQMTRDGGVGVVINRKTSTGDMVNLRKDGATVGTISTNGSTTSYNTSSDYRLKENVVEMTGATERLKQLQPKRFNFISDADTTVDGFLAHEVQTIVPEAINGEKDAVDEENNPVYQGIDQSKLVPLLVATIKELEARITALENA